MTKIAVSFQYLLLPIALTTEATQDGPEPSVMLAWSEAFAVGVTHTTVGELPVRDVGEHLRRRRNDVGLKTAGCSVNGAIASGAFQSPGPVFHW